MTEAAILAMVQARYAARGGNGQRYAVAFHVRNRAGFDAYRTLDAVVIDTWPSAGLALHGIEVKTSRGDWLRELAQPEKAAAFTRFMDFFWIAAPDGVVRPGELPDGWGLLAVRGGRLVSAHAARRGEPEPVDRSFLACLMRAACYRTPSMHHPEPPRISGEADAVNGPTALGTHHDNTHARNPSDPSARP